MTGRGGWLLLRRAGGVWGVPAVAVGGLGREGAGYRVEVGGGALAADDVLGVVDRLELRPLGAVVRAFWPEAAGDLAVHGCQPLVVVDPARPPAALRRGGGEAGDGD